MKTNLIQTTTQDDLILSGLYKPGDKSKPAVILIHGFTSDFYSYRFPHEIQEFLEGKNIASIAIQTRGTGIHTEFIKKDRKDSLWIGSFYEKLDEAHLDISAWIEYLKDQGYSRIVLAGHSLGTVKAVRYLFEGDHADDIEKLILLAPFDKNGYIERLTGGKWKEYVKIAKTKVENGEGGELIAPGYDDFPMSYQTYASWYEDSEISNLWDFYKGENYDCTLLSQINIPVQIIVGDCDEFFYATPYSTLESTKDILEKNIKDLDLNIIVGSGHSYVGYEEEVVRLVGEFLDEA